MSKEPLVQRFVQLFKRDLGQQKPMTEEELRACREFSEEISVDELGAIHIVRRLRLGRDEFVVRAPVEPYRIDIK